MLMFLVRHTQVFFVSGWVPDLWEIQRNTSRLFSMWWDVSFQAVDTLQSYNEQRLQECKETHLRIYPNINDPVTRISGNLKCALVSFFSFLSTQMLWKRHRRAVEKEGATCPWFQMSPLTNTESILWKLKVDSHISMTVMGCCPILMDFRTSNVPTYLAVWWIVLSLRTANGHSAPEADMMASDCVTYAYGMIQLCIDISWDGFKYTLVWQKLSCGNLPMQQFWRSWHQVPFKVTVTPVCWQSFTRHKVFLPEFLKIFTEGHCCSLLHVPKEKCDQASPNTAFTMKYTRSYCLFPHYTYTLHFTIIHKYALEYPL